MHLALIDADILVYEAAYRAQSAVEWDPGEWTEGASMPEAMADFETRVKSIESAVKAKDSILVLTDSAREINFRRSLWSGYKASREGVSSKRPLLYKALRQWVRDTYEVKQKPGIEGDDSLGIMATGDINGFPDVDDRVICSVDKDLKTVPGWHYNWRKHDEGIQYVSENEANYNHMMQTLTGDQTDGYPGLPNVGPKTAMKILADLHDPAERWRAVVFAYGDRGFTEGDALVQARCARIIQACDWDFDKEKVILWSPPKGN